MIADLNRRVARSEEIIADMDYLLSRPNCEHLREELCAIRALKERKFEYQRRIQENIDDDSDALDNFERAYLLVAMEELMLDAIVRHAKQPKHDGNSRKAVGELFDVFALIRQLASLAP